MTASSNVVTGLEDAEQSAASERAMYQGDRRNSGMFPCLIPKHVCLRKKENCKKGDAQ